MPRITFRKGKRRKNLKPCGTVHVGVAGSYALVNGLPKAIACQLHAITHQLCSADGYWVVASHEFFCSRRMFSRPDSYALPVGLLPALRRLVAQAGGKIAYSLRLTDLDPDVICKLAERAGHPTSDVDDAVKYLARFRDDRSRPDCLGGYDLERAARIGTPNHAMLALMGHSNHGLIRYAGGIDPAHLMAQIAIAFRGRRMGLVVPRREESARLANLLYLAGADNVWHFTEGWRPDVSAGAPIPMLSVGTPQQLINGWWWHWDLVVFQDAVEALAKVFELGSVARRVPRMHGLVPLNKSIAPGDLQRLRSWFGFTETTVLAGGRIPPTIEVFWERVVGGPPLSADADSGTFAREAYDTHPVRNRRVIHRARRAAATGSVAVLAGSVRHAAILARRLGDWPVRVGRDADLRGLSSHLTAALQAARSRPADLQVILAPAAAREIDLLRFDTVIRATGGTGVVPGLQRTSGVPSSSRRVIQLVDFDDRFDPRAHSYTRQRKRAYRESEWLGPGEDVVHARIKRFLNEGR